MSTIEQAQIAIREGNKAKARKILVDLVKAEPHNTNAWLLLAEILDDPQKVAYCREKAQAISERQIQQGSSSSSAISQNTGGVKKEQRKCPACAKLIPSDSRICPYCERRLSRPVPKSSKKASSKSTDTKQEENNGSCLTNIIVTLLMIAGAYYGIPFFLDLLSNVSPATVEYRIIGSSESATVVLVNAQGGIEQNDHYLPFNRSFSFKHRAYASISAINHDSGTITCQIWVNDNLWRESRSSGLYSSVSCDGIIGDR